MRQPELLVITASFPAGRGEGFLEEELRALIASGARLTVAPLWPRGAPRVLTEIDEAKIRFAITPLINLNILLTGALVGLRSSVRLLHWLWVILFKGRRGTRIKNLITLPKALWLAGLVQKFNIQHVHAHWASTTSTCAMIAADIANVPWSFTAHRWDIYEDNLLSIKAENASFARFISARGLADAQIYGAPTEKCRVIHMGVHLPSEQIDVEILNNEKPLRIICAANLIEVKGHKYLLEAISLLHAEGIPVILKVAGEGELRNDLECRTRLLDIESLVEFLGQIDHSYLLDLYRRREFDVFVLPSVELGNGEHEGIPVSLMEAMAHKLPVISTQTGSIEELLPRELGSTVPGGDAIALAHVLRQLATSIDLLQSYAARQFRLIQGWSSRAAADKLLHEIYKTLKF